MSNRYMNLASRSNGLTDEGEIVVQNMRFPPPGRWSTSAYIMLSRAEVGELQPTRSNMEGKEPWGKGKHRLSSGRRDCARKMGIGSLTASQRPYIWRVRPIYSTKKAHGWRFIAHTGSARMRPVASQPKGLGGLAARPLSLRRRVWTSRCSTLFYDL